MDKAAFRAEYCNLKNIAGRKVVQIIFEVNAERAHEVIDILGWPDAHSPKAVAIALLNEDAT